MHHGYTCFSRVFFQRNFDLIARYVEKVPVSVVLTAYMVIAFALTKYWGFSTENSISPILFFIVVLLIFRMSYWKPEFVNKKIRGNDISYGIYIWHMPIVNQMLYADLSASYWYVAIAVIASIFVAYISWRYIEKPALRMKSYTLNYRLSS